MRELEVHEYAHVTGAGESVTIYNGNGITVGSRLEPNQSTTITFTTAGGSSYSWNSGTFVSCFTVGGGVGLAVTAFTGNPAMGGLAALATSIGCTALASSTEDDGDEY